MKDVYTPYVSPLKMSENKHAKIKAAVSRKIILVHYKYVKEINQRKGDWSALKSLFSL